MIMTVEELKQFITTSQSDAALELKLKGLTSYIKSRTNNQFKEGFPDSIKLGVVGLFEWEEQYGSKKGISSETISRHSVTYKSNAELEGLYPKEMLQAIYKPYIKARF